MVMERWRPAVNVNALSPPAVWPGGGGVGALG